VSGSRSQANEPPAPLVRKESDDGPPTGHGS
jgi:hypothetical protein